MDFEPARKEAEKYLSAEKDLLLIEATTQWRLLRVRFLTWVQGLVRGELNRLKTKMKAEQQEQGSE